MGRIFFYAVSVTVFSITPYLQVYADREAHAQKQICIKDSGADLFDSEDDFFMQEASTTSVMQQELAVRPLSYFAIAVRKVWDKMLITYLWAHKKYTAASLYVISQLRLLQNHQNSIG